MSLPDDEQHEWVESEELGFSTRKFLDYCDLEKERLLNSDEEFDEDRFDKAVDLVLVKLAVLAEEGWV